MINAGSCRLGDDAVTRLTSLDQSVLDRWLFSQLPLRADRAQLRIGVERVQPSALRGRRSPDVVQQTKKARPLATVTYVVVRAEHGSGDRKKDADDNDDPVDN